MPQNKERKYFADPQSGRGNFDDAPFSLGANEWVNSSNIRTGSTDAGVVNTVESIGSTVLRSAFQPSVTFITIGSVEDTENNRLVYFQYDIYSGLHRIMCYYKNTQTNYTVLISNQVTGGLNFSKDFPIHSARIVNSMLYWVEGTNNEPRKINIESGIKLNDPSFVTEEVAYTSPLSPYEITIIKPTASLAPNIQKGLDTNFINNFIANFSFEFSYQFEYYDNEVSVVGTYSPASRLNTASDTYNYIAVVMDALQEIPSTVRIVNLIVRLGNTNSAKIVKTWDKDIASELAEIESHNDNINLLTFNFYNNITGPAIAEDYVLKPFDSVPIYSDALEIAKNRLFLADNISGYDTPAETSLEATLSITGISGVTSVIKPLVEVRAAVNVPGSGNDFAYGGWYVLLTNTETSVPGYYLLNGTEKDQTGNIGPLTPEDYYQSLPSLDPPPSSTSIAGLTFIGETQAKVIEYILYTYGANPGNTLAGSAFFTRSTLITITGITSTIDGVFKSRSGYKLGVVFYDFAMRKCGVVTNDDLLINIPSRNYAYSTATRSIIWTLDNANAANEIPDQALYYTIVRTLNLKTRYFVDAFTDAAKYATKDADGVYEFTNNTYVPQAVGIGLDTTALFQAGLGYSYQEGDIAVLVTEANDVYELPVIGQDGNYIIVKAQDIGDLTNLKIIYEVYTPYQTSDQEPFFEIGQMYRVLAPGTSGRQYETTSDVLIADAYTIQRSFDTDTYVAEAMSPNDLFFDEWHTDAGKPNLVTKLGQVRKKNFGSFSNTFIPGTSINGLSSFEALNEFSVPEDCGAIEKLILTSKVQEEQGSVMLAICAAETCSLYMGEVQISDSTGATQFFSASEGVIGTINVLKGNFGTINPESVTQYRGNCFWLDVPSGRVIQYSLNGLFPISNYKAVRFWNLWCKQYMSMTAAQIEALGGRPFVFSAVDPVHNELLLSIPKLSNTPPKGYLPDYPSEIYPFDILDLQGKTMVYCLNPEPNHWQGSFSFNPEGFCVLQNSLFAFKNGGLYEHNQTTSTNEFYGTQYKSRIMAYSTANPDLPKVYNNNSIQSNVVPSWVYLYNDYPYQQASDLVDFDFTQLEGIWYAPFYRNKLVPTAIGYNTDGLLTGEKMRGVTMGIMIEFNVSGTFLEFKFVDIGYDLSRGHQH